MSSILANFILFTWCVVTTYAYVEQRRSKKALQEKLNRIGATDDEIIAMLEATDSLTAKTMLKYFNDEKKLLPPQKPTGGYVSESEMRSILKTLKREDSNSNRLDALKFWIDKGFLFDDRDVARILSTFDTAISRQWVRNALNKSTIRP